MSSINPDYNNYVRNPDFKGENKQMPQIENLEDANVFYETDENGNTIRRFVDYNKDGNTDVISTFDSDGKITEEIIDQDGDGKADLHVSYDYDKDGNIVARHVDTDMDGNTDVMASVDLENLIYSEEIDVDDNGTPDIHVDYTYDEKGGEQRIIDYNRDGTPETISHVDENGNVVAEEMDTDLDGTLDSYSEYEVDADGNETVTNHRGIQAIEGDLQEGLVVEGGKILNEEGEQVGLVVDTPQGQTYYEFTD